MRSVLYRLLRVLRRTRHDADLREEVETHRSLRQAQLEREGVAPDEAAAAPTRAGECDAGSRGRALRLRCWLRHQPPARRGEESPRTSVVSWTARPIWPSLPIARICTPSTTTPSVITTNRRGNASALAVRAEHGIGRNQDRESTPAAPFFTAQSHRADRRRARATDQADVSGGKMAVSSIVKPGRSGVVSVCPASRRNSMAGANRSSACRNTRMVSVAGSTIQYSSTPDRS